MKDYFGNPEQLEELVAYIASQINVPTIGIGGGYAPLGTINFFDATVAPQDWLACDGSVYNIADYPQLAEWYATQHGASNFYGGNGTTTFAVPDLQGEFLRGTGTNSHTNQGSGAALGVHQDGTVIPSVYAYNDFGVAKGGISQIDNVTTGDNSFRYSSGALYSDTSARGNLYTSRPTNTSFLICVKAVVAGEVYSTEERVVGTWIDGKKLYRKTIDCGTMPNNSTKHISHGISDLDTVVLLKGIAQNANGQIIPLPNSVPSTQFVGYQSEIDILNDKIRITTGIDRSSMYAYVTIQYTKTTD